MKRSLYVNIFDEANEYKRLVKAYNKAVMRLKVFREKNKDILQDQCSDDTDSSGDSEDGITGLTQSHGAAVGGNTATHTTVTTTTTTTTGKNDTAASSEGWKEISAILQKQSVILQNLSVTFQNQSVILQNQSKEQRKQWCKDELRDFERSCRWLPTKDHVFFKQVPSPLYIPAYYETLWRTVQEELVQQTRRQSYIQLSGSPGIGKSTALALFASVLQSTSSLGALNQAAEQSLLAIMKAITQLLDLVVLVTANAVHVAFKGGSTKGSASSTAAAGGFIVFTSRSGSELADVAYTLDSMAATAKVLVLYDSGERAYRSSALDLAKCFVVSVLATSNDRTQYKEFTKNEAVRIVNGGPLEYEDAKALGLSNFDDRWSAAGGVLRHLRQDPAFVLCQIEENLRLLGPGSGSLSLECAPRMPYVFVDVPVEGRIVQEYASLEARERHVVKCDLLSEQRLAGRLQEALQQGLGDVAGRYFEMYGLKRLKGNQTVSITLHGLPPPSTPQQSTSKFAPPPELFKVTFSGTSAIHTLDHFNSSNFNCLLIPPQNNYPIIDALYVDSNEAVVYLIQYTISKSHKPCGKLQSCVDGWRNALLPLLPQLAFRFIWVGMDATRGVTTADSSLEMQQYATFINTGRQCVVQRQQGGTATAWDVQMPHDVQDAKAIKKADVVAQLKSQLFPYGHYKFKKSSIQYK